MPHGPLLPSIPLVYACATAALLSIAGCGDASAPPPALGAPTADAPAPPAPDGALDPSEDRFDERAFLAPAREHGPDVRWWWPGGAVDDATIASGLTSLAEVGFGGVELQTLSFGLSADDMEADPRIRTVGTPEQLARVATFLREAKRQGLRTGLTMGSGWPSGGAFATDVRPLELLKARVDVTGPQTISLPVPTPARPPWTLPSPLFTFPFIGSFDPPFDLVAVLAAPLLDGTGSSPVLGTPADVTAHVQAGRLVWEAPSGSHALVFVFRHRVDHLVIGDAFPRVPAAARVMSHLDPMAVETWLSSQQGAWLDSLSPLVPDQLFVESFELLGELPWSDGFAARFAAQKGYPLAPYLPFLFRTAGESKYQLVPAEANVPAFATRDATGARVREDYEDVRGELFLSSMIDPLARFAATRRAALRLQAHGGYAHVLDGYAAADIPETEGLYGVGSMDFLELAASAAHVAGRRVVSSETFPAFSTSGPVLTEDEMWMLAGRAYAAGVQRLVYHGVTYPYTRTNGARWAPFAKSDGSGADGAGALDVTSDIRPGEPGWEFLPAFNQAMRRLSYAMTRGVDRAEVAWLLDERELPDGVFFRADALPAEQGESTTSLALRKAGFRYDRISPRMLASASARDGVLTVGRARYRALVITDWPSASPDELAAVERALDANVPVIVQGAMPMRARGYAQAEARDREVARTRAAVADRLRVASDEADIARALATAAVARAIEVTRTDCKTVSLAQRELANGHLFFVFHEHAEDCQATLALHVPGRRAALLDPITGASQPQPRADEVTVSLTARRPLLLFVEARD